MVTERNDAAAVTAAQPDNVAAVRLIVKQSGQAGERVNPYRLVAGGRRISLAALNRIIEIDTANLVAQVEPGVTLGTLNEALRQQGLRFVPGDTPVYRHKTLGEFFYEGCSNLSGVKYGFAKHFLMGSEVVLPSGELLSTGGKTVKNVTGYDFTRFFNAPYADLGITVKFLLKLLPLPEACHRRLVSLALPADAFTLAGQLRAEKIVPSVLVWSSGQSRKLTGDPAADRDWLWLELDGVAEEVAALEQRLDSLLAERQGVTVAAGNALEAVLGPLIQGYSAEAAALTDELKLPLTAQPAFVEEVKTMAEINRVKMGVFGQIGEGKLHLALSAWGDDEHRFIRDVLAATVRHGGWSAGKYRRLYSGDEAGPLDFLEKRLRKLLDPDAVLSSGREGQ
ncbi:MAG TPA: FAD-binding oxidoreductase [Patescibacteria group bacterium]|nr:FAD-binding oxidoreductase [Patescibacteria group bacterium]